MIYYNISNINMYNIQKFVHGWEKYFVFSPSLLLPIGAYFGCEESGAARQKLVHTASECQQCRTFVEKP